MRVPAMVNAHSHAFQRDLRGVGERPSRPGDDFWSWREGMYALAARLDPGALEDVAHRAFTEMRAAGYGAVGEFHYLHHPDGMTQALVRAAQRAGLPLVLLPAAYHRGGIERFRDDDVEVFLERVEALGAGGVAAHSVRAVPPDWLAAIARYADARGLVRHVHASEQPREVAECRAAHGCTPIELLHRTGFLGPRTAVVHAIHVTERDVELLAQTDTIVVGCPTTEGNLGDGIFPALAYRDAGVRLAIGSDSNVRIDPFEEARELETLARRAGTTRDALLSREPDLWGVLARNGAAALGLAQTGTIELDTTHPDLAGVGAEDLPRALVMSGSAATLHDRSCPH